MDERCGRKGAVDDTRVPVLGNSTVVVRVKMGEEMRLRQCWIRIMKSIDKYCCVGYSFVCRRRCLWVQVAAKKNKGEGVRQCN